ncbi:hypothetical protein RvY_01879-3 [Ramazzottius varieornatus]|uniref:Glycosyl hydrolase family 31 C-terminal domain-containing protein n=1 Tax=Ramazzottius varieornatus TaxID=947166 RepID=A0A1D1UHY0_RAMVA|nr:hypothetical protein RvY_01879-3 [Ramazzottius varieornatus]
MVPASGDSLQAAAFQPFLRSHAHIETKRREPYPLRRKTHVDNARCPKASVYLPSILVHAGVPMMRPLWYAFPKDRNTFSTDDAFRLGDALLVKPATQKDATSVDVYFPGGATTRWYDVATLRCYDGGRTLRSTRFQCFKEAERLCLVGCA